MKKLLSVIVLAAMLVTMICPSFAAAGAEVKEFDTLTFTVDDVVLEDGENTVDVAVRVAGNGEHNCKTGIWGAAISLYYPSELEVVDIKNGDLFPDSEVVYDLEKWNTTTPDDSTQSALEENEIDVDGKDYKFGKFVAEEADYAGGVLENGVLFVVTIQIPTNVVKGDTWTIGVVAGKGDVCDCGTTRVDDDGKTVIDYVDIPFSLDNGSVTANYSTVSTVTVADASVTATYDVEVPVEVSSNAGIWAMRAELAYDPALLTFNGIKSGIFAVEDGVNYSVSDGVITVFVEGTEVADTVEDGALFTLLFTANAKAGNSPVTIKLLDVVNTNSVDLDVITEDGSVEIIAAPAISVGSLETFADKTVEIPVTISKNSGIVSARLEVAYDVEGLKFEGVTGGLFAADDTNASASNGIVTVFVENDEVADMAKDGVLFNLVFTTLKNEDAVYDLVATVIADSTINVNGDEVKFLGESGAITVKAHEHNYETVAVDPTCTEDGYIADICSICEDVKEPIDVIPATGHTEAAPVTVEATCTEDGYVRVNCAVCGRPIRETKIKATGHDWTAVETVAPTCVAEGYTAYVCANGCGEEKNDDFLPIDKVNGHTAGDKVVVAEPTYEADGTYEIHCTVCDEVVESGVIPMLSTITVTVGDATVKCGKDLTVPVVLDGNEGMFIIRLNVAYDADKLVYVGAENGEVFAAANVIFTKVADGNLTLYFEADGNEDVTANGVLANLKFTVVDDNAAAGETEIAVNVEDAVNLAEDDIYVYPVNGTVDIILGATVNVANASVQQCGDVEVPVSFNLNDGVWAVRAEYKYDATKLTFKGIKSGAFAAEDKVNYSENNGVITVFAEGTDVADVAGDVVLYTLQFTAKKVIGETTVEAKVIEAITVDSEDVEFRGVNGVIDITPMPAISVGKVDGYTGTTVKVPVTVTLNPGVISVRMEIKYDAASLEFVGVDSGLFNADDTNASAKDGVITVFVENSAIADMTDNGVAFYLNFTAKNEADAEYALEANIIADSTINVEGDEVTFITNDGAIVMHAHSTHTLVKETVDATCEADGYVGERCTVCGELVSYDVIPATGHSWTEVEVVPSTCVDHGYTLYICETCGTEEKRDYTDLVDHVHGESVIVVYPCLCDGVSVVLCEVCGEILSQEILPVIGSHTPGEPEIKVQSCTEEGLIVVHCTVCGEELSREVIPMDPHDTTGNTPIIESYATCTTDGITRIACNTCHEMIVLVNPAMGHLECEEPEIVEPTVDSEGAEIYRCITCGEVVRTVVIPALEFAPGDVNKDGVINFDDVYALLDAIMAGEFDADEDYDASLDFEPDGVINFDDVYALLDGIMAGKYDTDD